MTDQWHSVEGDEISFTEQHDFNTDSILVGVYKGTRQIPVRAYGGGQSVSTVHDFYVQREGSETWRIVSAWGTADLDSKLAKLQSGDYTRVVYRGKEALLRDGEPVRRDGAAVRVKIFDVAVGPTPDNSPMRGGTIAATTTSAAPVADEDIPF